MSFRDLEIPDTWTASAMLRNMAIDHLSADEAVDGTLDTATRQRMVGLLIVGHLDLADKVARLINIVQELAGVPEGDD